ncbi:Endoribonuclease L-PSP/chorismate mutase-like protein [Zopfochytrium polystomum]|nr:Endoribonuclease L-PSP/chorismate mutase-like protein [Zopfochytrium polystomum]
MAAPQLQHKNSFPHSYVFSHVVMDSEYAHLSGQLAMDGTKVAPGTPQIETRKCMQQISDTLKSVGLTMGHLTRVNLYITNLADLDEINREYARFFPDGKYPARTCVVVAGLIGGCRIEIEATARLPSSKL